MVVTVFFAIFGVVIALMKDVPDVKGDKEYGEDLQTLLSSWV